MKTTHTPGPWIADSWYVGPKDLPTLVKVNPNGPLGHEEVIANARLIAAAPDLLTTLQALADAVERYTNATPEDWPELAAARAAIETATGKA